MFCTQFQVQDRMGHLIHQKQAIKNEIIVNFHHKTHHNASRHSAALVTEVGPASSPSALPPQMGPRTNLNRRSLSALQDFGGRNNKALQGNLGPNKENVPPPRPGKDF